jgi:hypothetical protein
MGEFNGIFVSGGLRFSKQQLSNRFIMINLVLFLANVRKSTFLNIKNSNIYNRICLTKDLCAIIMIIWREKDLLVLSAKIQLNPFAHR